MWNGLRGELSKDFFEPDSEFGMVVATELGLMSTSTARETPVHYMGASGNVLWELKTGRED